MTSARFLFKALFYVCIILAWAGCDENHSEPAARSAACYSESDLSGLEVTIDELNAAYNDAVLDDPNIVNDAARLTCGIYELLKPLSARNDNRKTADICKEIPSFILTRAEMLYLFLPANALNVNIYNIPALSSSHDQATIAASENYPCDSGDHEPWNDDKCDAVRHAYGMALLAKRTSPAFAHEFGRRHEERCDNFGNRKRMDLHNNAVGIAVAVQNPSATDSQLLEMVMAKNFVFLENIPEVVPSEYSGDLVYFDGKRDFDVVMTGTCTNPDAGITWNMEIHFNQCNNTLRGNFNLTSGAYFQKRRFTGVMNGTEITLNVSEPFDFENAPGTFNCSGFIITLNGNSSNLSGNWTSTNCNQGGAITLAN